MDFELGKKTIKSRNFDNAIKKAQQNIISMVKLFYLTMVFITLQADYKKTTRTELYHHYKKELKTKEDKKSDRFCRGLYQTLFPFQELAIEHLKRDNTHLRHVLTSL